MATRAERMQQRIRGTGHGQVEGDDISFQIELGGDDDTTTEEGSPSSDATTPRASPRRTPERPSNGPVEEPEEPSTAIRTTDVAPEPISSGGRPVPDDIPPGTPDEATTPQGPVPQTTGSGFEEDDLLQLSAAARDALGSARSIASQRTILQEEVGESPIKAPGTGQRRSLRSSNVASSSVMLQQMISTVDLGDVDPLSSPSEQRTSRIRLSVTRARGSPQVAEAEEPDELSPEQTLWKSRSRNQASPDLSSPQKLKTPTPEPEAEPEPERTPTPVEEEPDSTQVEEASPVELAKTRRGRKRRSPAQAVDEPVEASIADEEPAEDTTEVQRPASVEPVEESPEPAPLDESPEPPRKRRRRPEKASPAKQKQGRRKPAEAPPSSQEAAAKPPKKRRAKRTGAETDGDDLVILTQRYSKKKRVSEGDNQEFSLHTADIPHANRNGVNCIDVLSSLFSEVIENAVSSLQEAKARASDAAAKREVTIKTRALEAFQAELRVHFLEHTINVDHAHALRQRIKQEKREKMDLRDEIQRLRAEREHVAIRKDAVRAKHEKRREDAIGQLDLSSALHDVELAIERGRTAPDLPPAEEKQADLANLELLVARLSEQGSTRSDTGGTLKQLKEFNAFLERAAAAMEGR